MSHNAGANSSRPDSREGFTLVELLLTVALILLLAGAVILSFGQMGRNAKLDEGTTQLETLLRFARAEAANTGKRVKIVFDAATPPAGVPGGLTNQVLTSDSTNTSIQVLWEPQPINFPGRFQPLPGASLLVDQINELVRVVLASQPAADGSLTNSLLSEETLAELRVASTNSPGSVNGGPGCMPPVLCYPDGSSDSVQLVVSPADDEDKRFMVVTLSGLTGSLRHRLVGFADDGRLIPETGLPSQEAGSVKSSN